MHTIATSLKTLYVQTAKHIEYHSFVCFSFSENQFVDFEEPNRELFDQIAEPHDNIRRRDIVFQREMICIQFLSQRTTQKMPAQHVDNRGQKLKICRMLRKLIELDQKRLSLFLLLKRIRTWFGRHMVWQIIGEMPIFAFNAETEQRVQTQPQRLLFADQLILILVDRVMLPHDIQIRQCRVLQVLNQVAHTVLNHELTRDRNLHTIKRVRVTTTSVLHPNRK
mmetsp:Transcript_4093/g.6956  ORF Transcript_4093/g.6956 Transcript_4093/m.6956 type:complete len:223 (+) Transcript_4093:421-1089(+)